MHCRFLLVLTVFALTATLSAQTFHPAAGDTALSFREIQRQFNDWKKTHDIDQIRGWKSFKRWENEMQFHTDAHGEPADATEYLQAAVDAAAEKEMNASARAQFPASWSPEGPNAVPNNLTGYMENGIGRINCIAFDPASASTYYIGVAQGGLWKTTNNGLSWTPLTDNLPITRISDIAIDPNNTSTIYISVCDFEYIGFGLFLNGRKRNTHYGLGVYKTTDGGLTWSSTGLSFQLTDYDASLIRRVIVNPANSNTIVACGVSGMYRSTDGGATWAHQMDTLFWDMVQDPSTPSTLYAASGWVANANDGYAAIYKSTNFGSSWTMLNTGIPPTGSVQRIRLAVAPSDPNYVYALAVDNISGLYGFYKSTNAGSSWNFVNPGVNILEAGDGTNSGGQGTYDLAFMVDAANRNTLYAGGVNLWKSADGAQTFDPVSHWTTFYGPTLHGDFHFIERQPLTGNIFACSDGGLYRTSSISSITWNDANNGVPWPTAWTNISSGMQTTSFYRVSSSKSADGRIMAGAQDNATFYFDGSTWSTIMGGDGMDNWINTQSTVDLIGSSQYGNFMMSNDGGQTSYQISVNVNGENAEWTSPVIHNPNDGRLYAGFENVTRSTDGGNTWSLISNFPSTIYGNEISALAVSNTNANVLVAAKRVRYEYGINGSVYRTTNGGGLWTDVTAGLPDSLYFTSVEIDETNANIAYVTMAGFSSGNKVFMTTNGGSSWQNISYNLPNIPVNCIRYIPGSGGQVIIATDLGIYTLLPSASAWVNQSTGLPNVIVSDIEFNVAMNKVYVSTFGRGIWSAPYSSLLTTTVQPSTNIFALNPSVNDGSFSITVPEAFSSALVEVVDIQGRVVYAGKLSGETNPSFRFDLLPGAYFMRVAGLGTKRFVIQ